MAPPFEIAIPSTSVSDEGSSKPYTLYNITLRLPLRSFVVQKRYSDFATLNTTLVNQVGEAPPQPLPGKHWLKSTVNSPELARERQLGLEKIPPLHRRDPRSTMAGHDRVAGVFEPAQF